VGTYKTQVLQGTVPGLRLLVLDPTKQAEITRDMNLEGRFAFSSQQGGEYTLCISLNGSTWFGTKQKVNIEIDIETGVRATDYVEVARLEQLSELELQIRKLNDKIQSIRAEQNYQRGREAVFRNTTESTNSRVVWWSIIQTIILLASGFWQISHLKSFFKAKKLV